jgi:hypothetical protein
MKIIPPVTVTDSIYTGGDIPETDASAWSNVTAYTVGNQAVYSHSLYEALTNNTNKQPDLYPADWVRVSATNAWKLFDYYSNSATSQAVSFEVELTMPYTCNALALFGLVGASVDISVVYNSVEIYSSSTKITVRPDAAGSWYGWLFGRFVQVGELSFTAGLPLPQGAVLTITVYANTGDNAQCAALVFGRSVAVGDTQYGSSVGLLDYSVISENAYGDLDITPGASYRSADFDVFVTPSESDYVQRTLNGLRAQPVAFIGSDDFAATKVLGIIRDAPLSYRDCASVMLSLNIRGVL